MGSPVYHGPDVEIFQSELAIVKLTVSKLSDVNGYSLVTVIHCLAAKTLNIGMPLTTEEHNDV